VKKMTVYKAKTMRIRTISPTGFPIEFPYRFGVGGDVILGVVELANLEIRREGGVEHYYHNIDGHVIGMRRAQFTIRRWFKADDEQTSLLYALYDTKTEFRLEEYLNISATGTEFLGLTLDNCTIYNWRLVTGTANDIVSEQATGEAEIWYKRTATPTFPLMFPIVW